MAFTPDVSRSIGQRPRPLSRREVRPQSQEERRVSPDERRSSTTSSFDSATLHDSEWNFASLVLEGADQQSETFELPPNLYVTSAAERPSSAESSEIVSNIPRLRTRLLEIINSDLQSLPADERTALSSQLNELTDGLEQALAQAITSGNREQLNAVGQRLSQLEIFNRYISCLEQIQSASTDVPEREQEMLQSLRQLVRRVYERASSRLESGNLEGYQEDLDQISLLTESVRSFGESRGSRERSAVHRRYLSGLREIHLGVQEATGEIDFSNSHIEHGLAHFTRGQAFEAFGELRRSVRSMSILPEAERQEFDRFVRGQYRQLQRHYRDSARVQQIINRVNERYLELQRAACTRQFDQIEARFERYGRIRRSDAQWQALVSRGRTMIQAARQLYDGGHIEESIEVFQQAVGLVDQAGLIFESYRALGRIHEFRGRLDSDRELRGLPVLRQLRARLHRARRLYQEVITRATAGEDTAVLAQEFSRANQLVSGIVDELNSALVQRDTARARQQMSRFLEQIRGNEATIREVRRSRAGDLTTLENFARGDGSVTLDQAQIAYRRIETHIRRWHVLSRIDSTLDVLRGIEADRRSFTATTGRTAARILSSPGAGLGSRQLDNYAAITTDGRVGEEAPEPSLLARAGNMLLSVVGGGYTSAVRQDGESRGRERQDAINLNGVSGDNLSELISTLERYRARVRSERAGTYREQLDYLDQVLSRNGQQVRFHPAVEQAMREINFLPTFARAGREMALTMVVPFYQAYSEYRQTGTVRTSTVVIDAVMLPFQLTIIGGVLGRGGRFAATTGRAVSSAMRSARMARLARLGRIVPAAAETETTVATTTRVSGLSRAVEFGRGAFGLYSSASVFGAPLAFGYRAVDEYLHQREQFLNGQRREAPEIPYLHIGMTALTSLVAARFGGHAVSAGRAGILRMRYSLASTEALETRITALRSSVISRAQAYSQDRMCSTVVTEAGEVQVGLSAENIAGLQLLRGEVEELRVLLSIARQRGMISAGSHATADSVLRGVGDVARADLSIEGYTGLRGALRNLLNRFRSARSASTAAPATSSSARPGPLASRPVSRPVGERTLADINPQEIVPNSPAPRSISDPAALQEVRDLLGANIHGQAEAEAALRQILVESDRQVPADLSEAPTGSDRNEVTSVATPSGMRSPGNVTSQTIPEARSIARSSTTIPRYRQQLFNRAQQAWEEASPEMRSEVEVALRELGLEPTPENLINHAIEIRVIEGAEANPLARRLVQLRNLGRAAEEVPGRLVRVPRFRGMTPEEIAQETGFDNLSLGEIDRLLRTSGEELGREVADNDTFEGRIVDRENSRIFEFWREGEENISIYLREKDGSRTEVGRLNRLPTEGEIVDTEILIGEDISNIRLSRNTNEELILSRDSLQEQVAAQELNPFADSVEPPTHSLRTPRREIAGRPAVAAEEVASPAIPGVRDASLEINANGDRAVRLSRANGELAADEFENLFTDLHRPGIDERRGIGINGDRSGRFTIERENGDYVLMENLPNGERRLREDIGVVRTVEDGVVGYELNGSQTGYPIDGGRVINGRLWLGRGGNLSREQIAINRAESDPITLGVGDQVEIILGTESEMGATVTVWRNTDGLLYVRSRETGRSVPLTGTATVGRDTSSTLVVPDVEGSVISRNHATVEVRGREIFIRDNSTNGTTYRIHRAPARPQDGVRDANLSITADGARQVVFPDLARLRAVNQVQMSVTGGADRGFTRPEITETEAVDAGRPELAGRPGALLRIQNRRVILVGDLHANITNLNRIRQQYENALREGASIVFLGDAIHTSVGRSEALADMTDSINIVDMIIGLRTQYPNQVHFIRGNHDGVTNEGVLSLSKGGVQQGVIFHNALNEARGEEYLGNLQEFFESSPRAAIIQVGNTVVIAGHTPVLSGEVTFDRLRTAVLRPGDEQALCWRRLWNRNGNPPSTEYNYTNEDVQNMRDAVRQELAREGVILPESVEIVIADGHTPGSASAYLQGGDPNHITLSAVRAGRLSVVEVSSEEGVRVVDIDGESGLADAAFGMREPRRFGPSDTLVDARPGAVEPSPQPEAFIQRLIRRYGSINPLSPDGQRTMNHNLSFLRGQAFNSAIVNLVVNFKTGMIMRTGQAEALQPNEQTLHIRIDQRTGIISEINLRGNAHLSELLRNTAAAYNRGQMLQGARAVEESLARYLQNLEIRRMSTEAIMRARSEALNDFNRVMDNGPAIIQ